MADNMVDISSIYDLIMKRQADFESLNISSVAINFNLNGQPINAKGFIRLKKDSVMQLSVQLFLGIELARIQITPDSIVVLDRINSQYYVTNAKEFKEATGIDFDFNIMQGILCNQLFITGVKNNELSKKMFNIGLLPPDRFEIKAKESSSAFEHTFIINKFTEIEKTILTGKINPYSLICEYGNFVKTDRFNYPHTISAATIDGRQRQHIEFNISKIEFDVPMNMSFSIPAKYTKGDIKNFKF